MTGNFTCTQRDDFEMNRNSLFASTLQKFWFISSHAKHLNIETAFIYPQLRRMFATNENMFYQSYDFTL